MHREILGLSEGDGNIVDHANGDKLDNRKSNLRVCTKSQNQHNQQARKVNKYSKYKGVDKVKGKRKKKWRARISVNGKSNTIGYYLTEEEAAIAYNIQAKELHGNFAVLNYVND